MSCESKIRDLKETAVGDEDVRCFHVAVEDVGLLTSISNPACSWLGALMDLRRVDISTPPAAAAYST